MTGFDQKWETIHASRQWGTTPNEHLVRYIRRMGPLLRVDADVLDVGCGAGAQTGTLADKFNVIGIDGSQAAIDRCQPHINADFRVADVCELPFETATFDLVTDVCCLQHILAPNHIMAMQEIHRVLKPGGKFFSVTARDDHYASLDTPLRTQSYLEARKLFTDSGFRIESLDTSNYTDRNGAYWVSHWIIAAEKS